MAPKANGSKAAMKRPAAAAGLAALEAIKRAAVEPAPARPRGSVYTSSDEEGPRRASRLAQPAGAPRFGQVAAAVPAVAALPAPSGALAGAATARAEEAERRAVAAESRAAVVAAESKAALGALEARAEAAEARAGTAAGLEKEVVGLKAELKVAQERIKELTGMWNEKVGALLSVEKKISHAEGRAECLQEQAKTAAEAVERAARAEERSEVMCDLQNKLPMLIRHVTGSLASQGYMGSKVLPKTIKLEIDDRACSVDNVLEKMKKDRSSLALTDPYGAEPCAQPAERPPAERPQTERPPGPRRSGSEGRERAPRDARDPPSCSQTPVETPAAPRTRSSSRERPQGGRRQGGEGAGGRSQGGEGAASGAEDGGKQPEDSARASMMQRAMSALSSSRSRQLKY